MAKLMPNLNLFFEFRHRPGRPRHLFPRALDTAHFVVGCFQPIDGDAKLKSWPCDLVEGLYGAISEHAVGGQLHHIGIDDFSDVREDLDDVLAHKGFTAQDLDQVQAGQLTKQSAVLCGIEIIVVADLPAWATAALQVALVGENDVGCVGARDPP